VSILVLVGNKSCFLGVVINALSFQQVMFSGF
jgi:hypothetical protein